MSVKGIYFVELATKKVVGRLERRGFFQQITWSPDGKWLCGVANSFGVSWSVARMADAEGKHRTLVYGEDGRHVYGGAVSPDGIYVLFTGNVQEDGDASGSGAPMALMRLRPENPFQLKTDQPSFRISFEPYGVRFWSFERRN